jgi:hypothetical protein
MEDIFPNEQSKTKVENNKRRFKGFEKYLFTFLKTALRIFFCDSMERLAMSGLSCSIKTLSLCDGSNAEIIFGGEEGGAAMEEVTGIVTLGVDC